MDSIIGTLTPILSTMATFTDIQTLIIVTMNSLMVIQTAVYALTPVTAAVEDMMLVLFVEIT